MPAAFHFTIAETIEKFATKQLSPVEFISPQLNRVQALQPRLNAFVHIDAESAIARARQAEFSFLKGTPLPTLFAIPLSIKSNIDVAGWPCPAGSLTRKDYIPTANATVVQRLEDAGAILLGNTNAPEFMMAYETDNRVTGKTSNPWNLDYSAGGSSGGEAAAIAGGCSMGGVGSDGGGSIRVPAHFCGICGLKPTPGRVPSTGHFPPSIGAFAWIGVLGPMARTVRDLRTIFEVIAGPCPGDPLSAPVPVRNDSRKTLQGLPVGILQSDALGYCTPETNLAVRHAADLLAGLGFALKEQRINNLDIALKLWWFFFAPVISHLIRESTKGEESLLSPMLNGYLEIAAAEPPVTLESFMKTCSQRDTVRTDILRQLQDVPILLSPVSSAPAYPHGSGNYRPGDPYNYQDTMRFSQWLNLAGFPGLSLPMGHSPEGLPINIQLIARPYEEDLLLRVAQVLEDARGPWQPPPI